MTAKTHLTGGLIAGAVAVQLTEPLAREQFVLYGLPYELESLNRITEMLSPVLNSPIGKFFNPTAIILIVFVLLGSLFPDIDHRNSKIGKKVKPLSILFNKFLGHRGIFHSWFLYNILYIAIFATYSMFAPAEYHYIYFFANTGFYIGCLSHLILDTFNKNPDEFINLVKKGNLKNILLTPELQNLLIVTGISIPTLTIIVTYAIESWLAGLELKAGRLGVMKSLEDLEDPRYYANIEPVQD